MKKIKISGVILGILLACTSCGSNNRDVEEKSVVEENVEEVVENVEENAYEKVNKMLMELTDYEAIAEVTYKSNKNENTYLTRQKARKTGEYKIEVIGPENVAGTITIYDNEVIYQYNPKNSGEVYMATDDTQERSELFLTSFIENYSKSLNSAVAVGNFEEGKVTTLETTINGDNPYINNEVLTVDNETLKPISLIIRDTKGEERIIITYKEFIYNQGISDKEFEVGK